MTIVNAGHTHPHAHDQSCHCVACRPLERPCGCFGCQQLVQAPNMMPTDIERQGLQQFLQSLTQQGWLAHEVMLDGAWHHTPSIEQTLEHSNQCSKPIIRVLKDGDKTGVIRFAWGRGNAGLIDDHSASYGLGRAIEQARSALAAPAP